jgi:hypothetical protein
MDTLGKFKTNFLNSTSSFNVGFNNRSPLSQYKSTMATSFQTPKLGSTLAKDGTSILVPDNSNALKGGEMIGEAVAGAVLDVGKAIIEKKEGKKKKDKEQKEPEQELKKGSFAQKTLDPEGYNNYVRARDEAKIKDVDFDSIFSLTT